MDEERSPYLRREWPTHVVALAREVQSLMGQI